MTEKQSVLMIEGPQGSGKTTAAQFIARLGYAQSRGIPSGENLQQNREAENWAASLEILDRAVSMGEPTVLDRSLWSLVVFNMRTKPDHRRLLYDLGCSLFRKHVNGADYKVVVILSTAEECIQRAGRSPLSITSIDESRREIEEYARFLKQLKSDGFNAVSIENTCIPTGEFFGRIQQLLE